MSSLFVMDRAYSLSTVLYLICVTLPLIRNAVLLPHMVFFTVSECWQSTSRYWGPLYSWWTLVFRSLNTFMAIKFNYTCLPVYVNAMLAQWVSFFQICRRLLMSNHNGRLNARARFRAMVDATVPFDINLGTTSLAHSANRESQHSVGNLNFFKERVLILI